MPRFGEVGPCRLVGTALGGLQTRAAGASSASPFDQEGGQASVGEGVAAQRHQAAAFKRSAVNAPPQRGSSLSGSRGGRHHGGVAATVEWRL